MHCYRSNSRFGFTLIEVVVAMVIMVSVLASALLAFSAHRKQLRLANQRMSAIVAADDLLVVLSGQEGGFPISGRGPIPGHPTWTWQTNVVGVTAPAGVELNVIRLTIDEVTPRGQRNNLVSLEVLESGL